MFTKLVAKLVRNNNKESFQNSVSVFTKFGLLISAINN